MCRNRRGPISCINALGFPAENLDHCRKFLVLGLSRTESADGRPRLSNEPGTSGLTVRLASGWNDIFIKNPLSRYCHVSRGKMVESGEQKWKRQEKLALALHRNSLILLGKHPLR